MKFTYHYDHQTGQWHCFEVVDGHEIYMVSKSTAEQARQWCEEQVSAAVEGM